MLRCAVAVVLTAAFLSPRWIVQTFAQPPENAAKKAVQKKQTKGRLPAYYGQIVNAEQRKRIYQIQATYNPRIDALQAEIDALVTKRDAEIRGVLTPEQRERLDVRVDEAKAAKAAKKEGEKKKVIPAKKAG
jgi:exonuclease V gamma subunit